MSLLRTKASLLIRNLCKKSNLKNSTRNYVNIYQQKTEQDIGNKRKLMAMFPNVVSDLGEILKKECSVPGLPEYLTEAVAYNVPIGKQIRALTLISSYQSLHKPEELKNSEIEKTFLMAWCIETVQSFYVIFDDIMDGSDTRRGKLCWYKRDGIGLNAIADGYMIENCAFMLMKKYFEKEPYYMSVTELIHDITQKTGVGQILDYEATISDGGPNYSLFTSHEYENVARYKNSYHSFKSPNMLALLMAGKYDAAIFEKTHDIWMKMGIIYQILNDYLDLYGDPNITGKRGNDIYEGKFSWFAVKALELSNPEQKQIMEGNYGVPDLDSERTVQNLFDELDLKGVYHRYETETVNSIREQIKQVPEIPPEIFYNTFRRFMGRELLLTN